MKRVFFLVVFLLILSTVYGQTSTENRWALGRWSGPGIEITLNDNGTGNLNATGNLLRYTGDIVFYFNGNNLRIFPSEGTSLLISFDVYRINNQRVILRLYANSRDNYFSLIKN